MSAPIRAISGTVIPHRGTSSPEPPDTLACEGPTAPLRSRGSLATLARARIDSQLLTSRYALRGCHRELRRSLAGAFAKAGPLEIGAVVEARQPEHEADQQEENEHGHRNDLRRKAERGRERVGRPVANDAVDVPMLAKPRSNVAHESHQPRERDRN